MTIYTLRCHNCAHEFIMTMPQELTQGFESGKKINGYSKLTHSIIYGCKATAYPWHYTEVVKIQTAPDDNSHIPA